MKKLKLLLFTIVFSFLIKSCATCNLICKDCETLDLEDCTCLPCTCDYTPCIHLTNETSKTWKPVAIGDFYGNIIIRNPPDPFFLTCRVDHTAILVREPVTWRFDNPVEPKYLIFTTNNGGFEISSNLVFLSSDSLVLFFPTTAEQEHVYYIPD